MKETEPPLRFQRILKIRHLVLLRTLGAELSLRACAEILSTSQSAISRTLAEIETQLGEKLFVRTTRSVVPTQIGSSMIFHAQRILGEIEQAEADFKALARGAVQVLHVGVMSGFSPRLLGVAIAAFVRRQPEVQLCFHEGLAADLFTQLRQNATSLLLSHVDVPRNDAEIEVRLLYQEEIAIVAARTHPLARRRRLRMADLVTQRWLLPPVGTTIRVAMEREILVSAASDMRLPPIIESTGPHFTAAVLEHSRCIAAVPREIAYWLQHERGIATTLDMKASLPAWPVCVARLTTRTASPAESSFVDCLLASAPALAANAGD